MQTPRLTRFRFPPVVSAVLLLAFLAAQCVALSHIYSHLGSGQPGSLIADSSRSDSGVSTGQMCSECLTSASLLGAAGSPDAPRFFSLAAAGVRVAHVAVAHFLGSRHYAFRSRAPPELP